MSEPAGRHEAREPSASEQRSEWLENLPREEKPDPFLTGEIPRRAALKTVVASTVLGFTSGGIAGVGVDAYRWLNRVFKMPSATPPAEASNFGETEHAPEKVPEKQYVPILRPEAIEGAKLIKTYDNRPAVGVFKPDGTFEKMVEGDPQADRSKVELWETPHGQMIFLEIDTKMIEKYEPGSLAVFYENSTRELTDRSRSPMTNLDMDKILYLLNEGKSSAGNKEDNRLRLVLTDKPIPGDTTYGNIILTRQPVGESETEPDKGFIEVGYNQKRGVKFVNDEYTAMGTIPTYQQSFR